MKWTKFWTRDYTYHYLENILSIYGTGLKRKGFPVFKDFLFIKKNGFSTLYSTNTDRLKFEKFFWRKFGKDKSTIKKLGSEFKKVSKAYLLASKLGSQEPIKALNKYNDAWIDFSVYIFTIWTLNNRFPGEISQRILNKAKNNGVRYETFMSTPSKKASALRFSDDILAGASISQLHKKYVWLPWVDLHAKEVTKEDIIQWAREHKPFSKQKMSLATLSNELKLNKKEKDLVFIVKELMYLSDYRDEVRRKGVYQAHFIYEKIAKMRKISYSDLMYYTTPEIISGVTLPKKEIKRRKGDVVCIMKNNRFCVLSGAKFGKYYKEIVGNEVKHSKEVKGLCASAGKVRGRVCIVKLDRDISKVKKGNILVAMTTHPEYSPKMAIAAAIVTDEGALTCHAAIFAREIGKPCIVGTKNGTAVLKDRDFVEVDANKGIVRKIK